MFVRPGVEDGDGGRSESGRSCRGGVRRRRSASRLRYGDDGGR